MTVDDNTQISQDDGRTAWPFLAAAAVVGVILAAVLVVALRSPHNSDSDKVVRAVQAFIAAHNGPDAARRRAAECPDFAAARSPLYGLDQDRVALVTAEAPTINAGRATVSVTTKLDRPNAPQRNATWNVVETTNGWHVCD